MPVLLQTAPDNLLAKQWLAFYKIGASVVSPVILQNTLLEQELIEHCQIPGTALRHHLCHLLRLLSLQM